MGRLDLHNYILKDKHGPYGLTKGRKAGASSLIYRPDKIDITKTTPYTEAFYHTIPRLYRPPTVFEIEFGEHIIRVVGGRHYMGTRLPHLPIDVEINIRRRINYIINLCLEVADKDLLKEIYKYHPIYRKGLYYSMNKYGDRVVQLCRVFPYLGVKIYGNSQTSRTVEANGMVLAGERLKRVAEYMKVPMVLRKIKPRAVRFYESYGKFDDIGIDYGFFPKKTLDQIKVISAFMVMGTDNTDSIKKWVIKNAPRFDRINMLRNSMVDIGDWLYNNTGTNFNPNTSLRKVLQETNAWHNRNFGRRGYGSNIDPDNIENFAVEPWAIETEIDGYRITPLTTKQHLVTEGTQMKHCVLTYADKVKKGISGIFSIKRGEDRATVELVREEKRGGSIIKPRQIRGIYNSKASETIENIVCRWVSYINYETTNQVQNRV